MTPEEFDAADDWDEDYDYDLIREILVVTPPVDAGKRNRQRDYVDKLNEYMTAGPDEYWIIDRFHRMMTAVRHGQPDLVIGETEFYRTSLLPGFELPLA